MSAECQKEFAERLASLQDDERRRLARDLHDGTMQNLLAVAMNLARLQSSVTVQRSSDRSEVYEESVRLVEMSIEDLRTMSHLLHLPVIEEFELPATIRNYVEGFAARSGIEIRVEVDADLGHVEPDVALGLLRILQECLTNIYRHSHSSSAEVSLARGDSVLELSVADKGLGIAPEILSKIETSTAGVGSTGMQETARLLGGHCEVRSSADGTVVHIRVPARKKSGRALDERP